MDELSLVHETEIDVDGNRYQVLVYCRDDGRHFAKTHFGHDDIIINDGVTLEEVLEKHQRLLPLAITSRQMLHQLRNVPTTPSRRHS
ncbi:MAG TPA: hypothetical protein VIU41_05600 [Geobacteraceae bacterium]